MGKKSEEKKEEVVEECTDAEVGQTKEEKAQETHAYPVKFTVSRQYTSGRIKGAWYDDNEIPEEGETEDVIDVVGFPDGVHPAHVSATMGLTINLGDYESAKISVTTTLPCYKEEIDDAFEAAKNYSGMKMLAEREFIKDTVMKKKRSK